MTVPIERQVECVRREIKLRERVYQRRVSEGKMSQALADNELEAMGAVLATLSAIEEGARLI